MSKASRGKRGEASVDAVLQSIPNGMLLSDVTLIDEKSGMSHQIDHIFFHPHGIFVVETKNYRGSFEVDAEGAWLRTCRGETTRIRNPLYQNKGHMKQLKRFLKNADAIVPIVVFVQNNAPYVADENVINLDDLPLFIDSYPYRNLLSVSECEAAKAEVETRSANISAREHVDNIAYLKAYRKEKEQEMAYAIETGRCPVCGKPMLKREFRYKCSACDFHFSL